MVELIELFLLLAFAICQLMAVFLVVFLLRKRQLWPLILIGLKGHGTIIQRAFKGGGCTFSTTSKPVEKVPWKLKNNKVNSGKSKKVFTRITGVKHFLLGTGIALHICPFNSPTNVSVFSEDNKGLSSEELGDMLYFSYGEGVLDARNISMPNKGFEINWKLVIIVGVLAMMAILLGPGVLQQIQAVA